MILKSAIILGLGPAWGSVPLGPGAAAHDTAQSALDALASAEAVAFQPDEGRLVIDIRVAPELSEGAALAYEACIGEQDAARLRGEIIVCRTIEDGASVSGFDKEEWERDYAHRTQGVKTPNVEGAGGSILYRAEGSVFLVTTGKITMGEAEEGALIIDVTTLPEAPPGSDADRIARGLAPLNEE